MARAIVLMGVAGSGKTTVGRALAERLGCAFFDGDDFHPPHNVARMAAGVPLTDEERLPWLATLQALLHEHLSRGEGVVLACSALKRHYREQLRARNDKVLFFFLDGDYELISQRMQHRPDHFMPPSLLQSQFADLERPGPEEAVGLDAGQDVIELVERMVALLSGG